MLVAEREICHQMRREQRERERDEGELRVDCTTQRGYDGYSKRERERRMTRKIGKDAHPFTPSTAFSFVALLAAFTRRSDLTNVALQVRRYVGTQVRRYASTRCVGIHSNRWVNETLIRQPIS